MFFFSPSKATYYNISLKEWEQVVGKIREQYQLYSIPDEKNFIIEKYTNTAYSSFKSRLGKLTQARGESRDTSHITGKKLDCCALIDTSNHEHNQTVYICEIKTETNSKQRPNLPKIGVTMKNILKEVLKCNVSHENYSVLVS
ncbi:hypothetical protein K501DRAFT_280127 [Backusella circina FSU 941]|nr:hypothetical protein K501DRAFT_280127 [Backusella circina FSU 941]